MTSLPQSEKAPIPKFGSFHPKKSVSKQDSRHDRGRPAGRDDREKKRKRDRDIATESQSDLSLQSRPSSKAHDKRHRGPLPVAENRSDDFFIVDRRGDPKNVEYGSNHRYDVSSYHRVGGGRLLGAPPNVRLDKERSTTTQAVLIVEGRSSRIERPLGSQRLQKSENNLRMIISSDAKSVWDFESDQIKFKSRDRSPGLLEKESLDVADYRSIEGQTRQVEIPSDDDLETVPDSELAGILTRDTHVRHQNAVLSRQTKENAKDLRAWLDLINYQQNVLFPDKQGASLTTSERRALADIRLSIYQQAGKHFSKTSTDMEDLTLGMMNERQRLLDSAQLSAKWLEVLRDHPTSIKLWTRYLDHVQGSHLEFKFEECKARYLQCLRIISDAGHQTSDPTQLMANQVHVLTRLTALLRDAGYTELATSIWQAVLELCSTSADVYSSQGDDNHPFETFWESDVPRIGEERALSLQNFKINGNKGAREVSTGAKVSANHTTVAGFAQQELQLAATHLFPAAASEDLDDPFCFVMYTEMSDILTLLLPGIPMLMLLDAFLAYHNLPPLNHSDNSRKAWQIDPYSNQWAHVECRPVSLSWLFSTAFDGCGSNVVPGPSISQTMRFVDRVLDKICTARPHLEIVAEYYIAFKMQLLPQEVGRAKKLIKARPQSLRLYNAYALAEAGLGRLEKAREVWHLASGMVNGHDLASRLPSCSLYCSWIQTEAEREHEDEAAAVLARIGTSTEVGDVQDLESSVARLRISQDLQRLWGDAVDRKRFDCAVSVTECMGWFLYLTEGRDISQLMEMIRTRSTTLIKYDALEESELLHEAKVRMIAHHLECHRSYKPAMVRTELKDSLKLFPNNTFFLKTYTEYESRFDLNDRIRAPFRDELMNNKSPTFPMLAFAIDQELCRYTDKAGGASEHSVRNLFIKTLLQTGPAQHSISLWKKWFSFEHSIGLPSENSASNAAEKGRRMERARQVFLDGLRYLPWHKEWALLGMSAQWGLSGITEKQLKQVYDVLFERELRVRVEMG